MRARDTNTAATGVLPQGPSRAGALSDGALRRVCLFIHANLDRPLQLRDLAAAARLSRFHFARAFKVATRRTPRRFLLQARLDRAARLLRLTERPLAEIAFACGFSSQSRLTTAFRLATGLTPARFRRGRGAALALTLAASSVLVLLSGCQVIESYRYCADPEPARAAALPARLSETNLYADIRTDALAAGVLPYRPAFELWSDQAMKRRWISLPAGSQIDTTDPDSWQFPVGTKVWKEFSRDGVRVETRLIQRIGPGPDDWALMAYLWDDTGSDAFAVPDGVVDARQTPHNVPSAAECMGCHGGRRSRLLGFSAIQLAHDDPAGMVTLDQLQSRGLLTTPIAGPTTLQAPAETTAAIGYLHANCSHCHNQDRPARSGGPRCFDPEQKFDFFLRTRDLGAAEQTAAYRTAVGSVIKRGNADDSEVIQRMSGRGRFPVSMPPLGSERVDDHGVALVRAWIEGL